MAKIVESHRSALLNEIEKRIGTIESEFITSKYNNGQIDALKDLHKWVITEWENKITEWENKYDSRR